ncbi:hypothetical protein ACTUM7_01255 [Basfia succiniciproducens]|uniref:hypothetical protein n=1 Tax=Basfia succiniciproducens TaxID=653940 RepID=UPI003FCD555B
MKLFLDNESEFEIARQDNNKFKASVKHANGVFVVLGTHERFMDCFDELVACQLSLEEMDSLADLQAAVKDLAFRTDDWFARHDEYLANL